MITVYVTLVTCGCFLPQSNDNYFSSVLIQKKEISLPAKTDIWSLLDMLKFHWQWLNYNCSNRMEIAICQLMSRVIKSHHCILCCLCIVLLPLAFTWFLELILLHDVQLPFPVDCLYADPDRTVICCLVHTLMMSISDFSSFSDCKFWLK